MTRWGWVGTALFYKTALCTKVCVSSKRSTQKDLRARFVEQTYPKENKHLHCLPLSKKQRATEERQGSKGLELCALTSGTS
eukprot:746837-Hanusia_phi.AAC.1